MTPTHELVVFESEERIRRVQELGMEHDLDAIVDGVEQLATANAGEGRKTII